MNFKRYLQGMRQFHPFLIYSSCFIHVSSTSLMCGPEDDCHLQSWWAHGLWMFSYDLDYTSTKQRSKKFQRNQSKQQIYGVSTPWKLGNKSLLKKKRTDIFSCQNWEAPMTNGFPLARLFFEICHWHLGTFGSLVASAEPALIQRCPMTKRNILATLWFWGFSGFLIRRLHPWLLGSPNVTGIFALCGWILWAVSQGFLTSSLIFSCSRLFTQL